MDTLDSLEAYFNSIELPESARLNNYLIIIDVPLFLDSHFCILRANSGNRTFMGYYLRLIAFKEYMELKKGVVSPL